MRIKQTRTLIHYFVRYSIINRKKTATEGDTGIMLGLRRRRVFAAHSNVLSLLSLQEGKKTSATVTASDWSGGCRAGISTERLNLSGQRELPYGMLHNHCFGSHGKNWMSCYSVFKVLTLEVHLKTLSEPRGGFSNTRLTVYILGLLSPWLRYLNSTTQEKWQYLSKGLYPSLFLISRKKVTVSLHNFWKMVTSLVLFWITSQFDKEG